MMANPRADDGRLDPVSYDDQKRVARGGSHEERCELAARPDIRPEILYYLAGDPDPGVRRYIAQNGATPRHADLLLARDDDDRVRSDVAGKIAEVTVRMPVDDQSNVYGITMQALEILAGDQLVRVRQILADTLKDSSAAPRHVIEKLASDEEISVSGPVLENSPVLGDDFLISILNSEPVQGALKAISRRVALGEEVADAIVNAGDADAIAELLGNRSAQIREETLDRIVDQAPGNPGWHEPLVGRPRLHISAARRIADIVTGPLLAELKRRTDLDDGAMAAIDEVIQRRLDGRNIEDLADLWKPGSPAAGEARSTVADPVWAKGRAVSPDQAGLVEPDWALKPGGGGAGARQSVGERARKLHAAGSLTEDAVSNALAEGHSDFVTMSLACLANVPEDVVRKATSLQNAKAIVALAWKAGLSMRLATRLQMHLAGIAPSGVLRASSGDEYPMSAEEMEWQLEFVAGVPGAA